MRYSRSGLTILIREMFLPDTDSWTVFRMLSFGWETT